MHHHIDTSDGQVVREIKKYLIRRMIGKILV